MSVADVVRDWREPACHPAVQRVVVEGLVMRLMRLALDRALNIRGEDRVAAPAISSAVGHVAVEFEIVPTRGEGRPVVERPERLERTAHRVAADEHEPVL